MSRGVSRWPGQGDTKLTLDSGHGTGVRGSGQWTVNSGQWSVEVEKSAWRRTHVSAWRRTKSPIAYQLEKKSACGRAEQCKTDAWKSANKSKTRRNKVLLGHF